MKLSEYQFLVLLNVLRHACKFHEFDGMKGQELMKLYNEIMSQQSKEVNDIDEFKYACEHDYGNTIYTSNPAQKKCIKCGKFEFV